MNKREKILGLLEGSSQQDYVPAGFFIHFPEAYHQGQAAIDKHLEYFHYTDMDFLKIQFENRFPVRSEIKKPADWAHMPLYGQDFYENQLGIVAGLVKAAKKESLVIMTVYSPFMCAGQTVGREQLFAQLRENPDEVKKGLEIITESLLGFVKACINLGIDGFYASTQGGEQDQLGASPLFVDYVKPSDLALMAEMERHGICNILHVCDYHGSYDDFSPFLDYPGHIVNCNPQLDGKSLAGQQIAKLFGRPYMGGLDRHGIIAQGKPDDVALAVDDILVAAPEQFILGADCTLPDDVSWENIRSAIARAHLFAL